MADQDVLSPLLNVTNKTSSSDFSSSDMGVTYAAITTMAVVAIYIGSHLSLAQKWEESMSSQDALKFPIVGSCTLGGLYLLFQYFNKDYVNMLLTGYFLFFGLLALKATIRPIFEPFFASPFSAWKWEFKVPLIKEPIKVDFDSVDIAALAVSAVFTAWYAVTKHWIANNILGFCFSVQGIALISLGNYKTGCILLVGLFFYDVWWVFGTEVMVTVAKSFDAPIKLIFPKNMFASKLEFAMLGLGDIVIPGIFIALLLRFDQARFGDKQRPGSFAKPYFWICYAGYVLGLVATIAVMHVFKAAQPALLYLVPACLAASSVTAVVRGEFSALLEYTDEQPAKEDAAKDKVAVATPDTATDAVDSQPAAAKKDQPAKVVEAEGVTTRGSAAKRKPAKA
eukprot:TRINITY_DN11776_c0_g1_i1.p1 TRINITY_DN11776_c0_g1~~TRINITY_DN11776_c0_g1_i1.p1  ORF type:complete len:396 (-),score=121.39 TRINITY_DN11776_c0_g1_i1:55-1242(-)